ncbi:pathogenesis-related protein 1 [Tanacetum coccineum]
MGSSNNISLVLAIIMAISLLSFAQNYANQRQADCQLVHSQNGPYGENLAWGTALTGASAVNLWVGEKADYDYNSNTCAPGKTCGHYTQVVWRQSVRLGCARVQCNSGAWFVTCNYDPPDYVNAHNAAQKEVGVGLLKWDATVAKFAGRYANQRKD